MSTPNLIVSELSDEEAREVLRQLKDAPIEYVRPDVDHERAQEAYRRMRLAQVDAQLMHVVQRSQELAVLAGSLLGEVLSLNERVRTTLQELNQ